MENFIVSARKYRPSTFASVVGQQALTTTLKNAITSGHLAHAYLFCGPRGVGKTTCARIFAKTINCLNPTADHEACNECESCKAFNEQRSFNIHELDAASNNSVDDIRSLIEQVRIPPQIGKYGVYIVDEVHMLSASAFNAFLKTLEEPPAHAVFILATTEKHKILPTILSRCQIYDFNRITIADTVAHLAYVAKNEGVEAEPEALNVIAQKADGGMRDALSIFDQMVSFCGKSISYKNAIETLNVLDCEYYFRLVDCFLKNDVPNALLIFNEVLNKGFDAQYFVSGLSSHLRDVLVSRDASTLCLLETSESIAKRYQAQAAVCQPAFLFQALRLANECDLAYRTARNKRLLVELMLIKLCQITSPLPPNGTDAPTLGKVQAAPSAPAQAAPAATNASAPTQSTAQVTLSTATKIIRPVAEKPQKAPPVAPPIVSISISQAQAPAQAVQDAPSEPQKSAQPERVYSNPTLTEDDVVAAWRGLATRAKNDARLTSIFINYTPVLLSDNVFEVGVSNPMQEKELKQMQSQILDFMRDRLDHGLLRMQVKQEEHINTTQAFTAEDKFKVLLQQNPALQQFKDILTLQLD